MTNLSNKYSSILWIVGVLFIIWGVLGLLDTKNIPYSGYYTGDNWSIIKIDKGSPAETAGLQKGDVIKSTGGIAVTDTKALNKRQRAAIGEPREIIVDRNGEEVALSLVFAGLSNMEKTNTLVRGFIGFLFIVLGLYANHKYKSTLSQAYAVFAVCFGFLLFGGPYISSVFLGNIVNLISTAVVLSAFTALAFYMLRYPPESAFLSSKNSRLLYVPLLILFAVITVITILQPEATGTLNMVIRLLFGVFIIGNFLVALITLFRKYMQASKADRNAMGLNMMLLGTLIGLVPILIYFTVSTLSQETELPGSDYVTYTFAAIPVCFSMALDKVSKHTAD